MWKLSQQMVLLNQTTLFTCSDYPLQRQKTKSWSRRYKSEYFLVAAINALPLDSS